MNKYIFVLLIVGSLVLLGIGFFVRGFFIDNGPDWQNSGELMQESDLVSSSVDLFELVEVCNTKRAFFILKGEGRILLAMKNTYFYSVKGFDPEEDIVLDTVEEKPSMRDATVTVREISVTSNPLPERGAWVLDESILMRDNRRKEDLKSKMDERLLAIANNRINTEKAKKELSEFIGNNIKNIYAYAGLQLREVNIEYDEDALPEEIPYQKYKFDQECSSNERSGMFNTLDVDNLGQNQPQVILSDTTEGLRVYEWNQAN